MGAMAEEQDAANALEETDEGETDETGEVDATDESDESDEGETDETGEVVETDEPDESDESSLLEGETSCLKIGQACNADQKSNSCCSDAAGQAQCKENNWKQYVCTSR